MGNTDVCCLYFSVLLPPRERRPKVGALTHVPEPCPRQSLRVTKARCTGHFQTGQLHTSRWHRTDAFSAMATCPKHRAPRTLRAVRVETLHGPISSIFLVQLPTCADSASDQAL